MCGVLPSLSAPPVGRMLWCLDPWVFLHVGNFKKKLMLLKRLCAFPGNQRKPTNKYPRHGGQSSRKMPKVGGSDSGNGHHGLCFVSPAPARTSRSDLAEIGKGLGAVIAKAMESARAAEEATPNAGNEWFYLSTDRGEIEKALDETNCQCWWR